MPRAKSHSREDALQGAMQLFWKKGFHASSMEELVQSTGVSRYSFYDSFGSKRELFLEALDHYFARYIHPSLKILERDGAGLDELKAYFARLVMIANGEDGRYGCLITNTATELAPHDLEIAQKLRGYRDTVLGLLTRALRNGQSAGQVRRDISLEGVASQLYIILQGMMVMCKLPGSDRLTEKAAHAALLALQLENESTVAA